VPHIPRTLLLAGGVAAVAAAARRVTRRGPAADQAGAAVTIARDPADVEGAWSDAAARPGFLTGATVAEVSFDAAPGGRGTELRVRVSYPDAGAALSGGSAAGRLRADLRRFKAALEAGTTVEVDDAVAARSGLARTVTERAGHLLGTGGRL
jgi:hypothetical protein